MQLLNTFDSITLTWGGIVIDLIAVDSNAFSPIKCNSEFSQNATFWSELQLLNTFDSITLTWGGIGMLIQMLFHQLNVIQNFHKRLLEVNCNY